VEEILFTGTLSWAEWRQAAAENAYNSPHLLFNSLLTLCALCNESNPPKVGVVGIIAVALLSWNSSPSEAGPPEIRAAPQRHSDTSRLIRGVFAKYILILIAAVLAVAKANWEKMGFHKRIRF
jgi:hypothetical protein